MARKQTPRVAIVGRMNVGKSTFFNRVICDKKSLVLDYDGVTRDPLFEPVSWKGLSFDLVDTGGMGLGRSPGELDSIAQDRSVKEALKADVVLFMCDGKAGAVLGDYAIARALHKNNRPTFVLVNKFDTKLAQEQMYEFGSLGFKDIFPISSCHGTGIDELFDAVSEVLPDRAREHTPEKPVCSISIIGRPNVGKSSLMNALLGTDRSLVSDIPGTTREAITSFKRMDENTLRLVDTAGIRRKRSVNEPLEVLMVKSSLQQVRTADVVLLMIDASQDLADQDVKLAFYAFDECKKPLIVLLNKWDLIDAEQEERIMDQLKQYDHLFRKVVFRRISCETKKNIGCILAWTQEVWQRAQQEFCPEELTHLLLDALRKKPLYRQGTLIKMYRARQVGKVPTRIFLNISCPSRLLGDTQFGFFENTIRKRFDLRGVPVRFVVRPNRKIA